ncbi:hypothetical protein HA402_008468 [Bradysia odoriphaga]|nr:hypothetical protein HA402_008468 [Bradysia odoriphaga]
MKLTKVSNDLVTVEIKESIDENSDKLMAKINCPFCLKSIPVAHSSARLPSGRLSKAWWNTSNFDNHLKSHRYSFAEKAEHCDNTGVSAEVTTSSNSSKDESISENTEHNHDLRSSSNVTSENMLQIFMKSAQRHSNRNKHGYRHDDTTKMFAGFLKMVGGLLAYETLHANFPLSLPSVSTVNRFLTDNGPRVIEGEMRVDELLEYLQSRNMPLRISISEDGTRCTAKISYDPKTNQLVGFALPLGSNGMPITSSFPARNVQEIYRHFTNSLNFISSTSYVQMAQPTEPTGATPFCLMMYATDNKFTALDVYRRWNFQAGILNGKGIEINNIASDGDPRLLMAMKVLSRIGQYDQSYLDCKWFSCGGYVQTTFTQDYVHIITKQRNRILKYSRIFPIGDRVISFSHLKYLIENVSKDKHLLTYYDIEPKDRQNFPSAEKICSEKTMQCLLEYVPGSEGTVIYLKAMRNILTAFQKTELPSEERIYSIWYACFFVRAWRSWILNSEKSKSSARNRPKSYYNLKENFMSSNCYTCIELNAHALVKQILVEDEELNNQQHGNLVQKPVPNKRSNYFFSSLFDSQVCESVFRQVRSFTSTFCTVVNFTILDIMNRIRKIQLQNEIINASREVIKFPRFEKKTDGILNSINNGRQPFNVLNRQTIITHIERARDAVIADLEKMEIETSKLNFHCQIRPAYEEDLSGTNSDQDSDLDCEFKSDSEFENEQENQNPCQNPNIDFMNEVISEEESDEHEGFLEDINFLEENLDNLQEDISLSEEGPFVVVIDGTGKSKVVRKSAVCYVLARDKHKLSSDRLQRVQEKEYTVDKSRNRIFPSPENFQENEDIMIGDWCVFPDCVEKENDVDCESDSVLLGLVLGLTYLKGKTFRQREFTKSFASVKPDPVKPVGVMCDLYSFNTNGVLKSVSGDKHKFFKIDYYKGTIRPPVKQNESLTISRDLVTNLNKIYI